MVGSVGVGVRANELWVWGVHSDGCGCGLFVETNVGMDCPPIVGVDCSRSEAIPAFCEQFCTYMASTLSSLCPRSSVAKGDFCMFELRIWFWIQARCKLLDAN